MQYQPTINIGLIGSVSNGKSTIVEKITGIKTQKYSSEQKRNITIKLGYANAKIFKCGSCPRPQCYQSFNSSTFEAKCRICQGTLELIRHVSFIDCPGHNHLLETMLNGTCIMDYTILVESISNKIMPSQQTVEHIKATTILNVENIVSCINKVDLSNKETVKKTAYSLQQYLSSHNVNGEIVPVSANMDWNIDVLCEYICTLTKQPEHDLTLFPKMIVVRSFNVNKPNTKFEDLVGGVLGGSIIKGKFKVGDRVNIVPGLVKNNSYMPITSTIMSINSENSLLNEATPGGLLGIGLDIDPALTVNDGMTGQIIFLEDKPLNYQVYNYLGVKLKPINDDYKLLKKGDTVSINYCGNNVVATIDKISSETNMLLSLNKIVCIEYKDTVTISKKRTNSENTTGIIYGTAILLNKYCKIVEKSIG